MDSRRNLASLVVFGFCVFVAFGSFSKETAEKLEMGGGMGMTKVMVEVTNTSDKMISCLVDARFKKGGHHPGLGQRSGTRDSAGWDEVGRADHG